VRICVIYRERYSAFLRALCVFAVKILSSVTASIHGLLRQRWLVYGLLFLAGTALAALPYRQLGSPPPTVHDEFANLLIADTLLDGRLANPPHSLHQLFETFHVLQEPAYVGKYPPGQGLQLAVGQWLGGEPIVGVWLTAGLLAMAWCWMLEAVTPRARAVALSLVLVIYEVAATYWGGSYWGGSLFALSGALVFGGALRLWRWPRFPWAAAGWSGIGAGLALLTRPYEGFFFCLVPAAAMAWKLGNFARQGLLRRALAIALAAAVPLAGAAAFVLAYNHATTGSAFVFAHQLYEKTVMPDRGLFVWDKLGAPVEGRPPEMDWYFRDFKPGQWGQADFRMVDVLKRVVKIDLRMLVQMFLPWWLWPFLAAGIVAALLRRRGARLALATLFTLLLVMASVRWFYFPHYAAAWTAPVAVLAATGERELRQLTAKKMGSSLLPGLWWLAIFAFVLADYAPYVKAEGSITSVPLEGSNFRNLWRARFFEGPMRQREALEKKLLERALAGGRGQVLVVEYPPDYKREIEWIHNGPDIDRQSVIYARYRDAQTIPLLRSYYPNRDLWRARLTPDGTLQGSVELIGP